MAYSSFFHFEAASATTTDRAAIQQPDIGADLINLGQNDGIPSKDVPEGCPPAQWIHSVHTRLEALANVNVASGSSAGGLNDSSLTLIKHVGSLSPMIFNACAKRCLFDLKVRLMAASGGKGNEKAGHVEIASFELKNATLKSVRLFTGDKNYGSAASSLNTGAASDTRELEELVIVYQRLFFTWKEGNKKTDWTMGGGKSG